MKVKQFAILIVGFTLAAAIIRFEPIRGNPFYNPVRESIAQYLGDEQYRTPAVSHELNWVAAAIILFGTVASAYIIRRPTPPREVAHHHHHHAFDTEP
ncbi:MAG: hypothetical protein R2834_02295 [Rhodothermales bacterium]